MDTTYTASTASNGRSTDIIIRITPDAPDSMFNSAAQLTAERHVTALAHRLAADVLDRLPLWSVCSYPTVDPGTSWARAATARVTIEHDGDKAAQVAIDEALAPLVAASRRSG